MYHLFINRVCVDMQVTFSGAVKSALIFDRKGYAGDNECMVFHVNEDQDEIKDYLTCK